MVVPRYGCSIGLAERVVVTGGYWAPRQATLYTQLGWEADLPSLNTPRQGHACGTFVNTDNQRVREHRG